MTADVGRPPTASTTAARCRTVLLQPTACPGRELGPVGQRKLGEDVSDVTFDSPYGEMQLRADLLVGLAVGDKSRNLLFTDA